MKKIIFPVVCMLVSIAGAVCDFAVTIKDKDLDEKIDEAVAKRFEEKDSE